VLVVEDEARIAAFLVRGLRAQGYAVDHVATGGEALRRAGGPDPDIDLMILDLGLPDIDGTEVLRRLRAAGSRLPILVLTARGEVGDRVEGLDLGADDYLVKPFAFDELLARIRARVRRDAGPSTVLRVGDVELDIPSRRVSVGEERFDLTAREFALLRVFLRRPGQVLTREQILSQVWELDWDPGSNVVDVYVGYLRKKLGDGRIETVRGVGYRFAGDP
jgi:DNA-binding response OmpR family regulator